MATSGKFATRLSAVGPGEDAEELEEPELQWIEVRLDGGERPGVVGDDGPVQGLQQTLARREVTVPTAALADYKDKLRSLAGELAGIGFMTRGSVVERRTRCGKPGCACKADPPVLHGPYWQFSRAVQGRTVTHWITEDQAALYREWIANRRKAIGILAEIEEVSRQAEAVLHDHAPGQVGQVPGPLIHSLFTK